MMDETNTPYKHLSTHGNNTRNQKKWLHKPLNSIRKQTSDATVSDDQRRAYELHHFQQSSSTANDDISLSSSFTTNAIPGKNLRWSRRCVALVTGVFLVTAVVIATIICLWAMQQEKNIEIIKKISIWKSKLYKGVNSISKEMKIMKKSWKRDYCYGKSICYPYSTCYGRNCTCRPILPRDQSYCQRTQCGSTRVKAAYSNTEDGKTYMTDGHLLYQLKRRYRGERFASVAKTWPRSNYDIWRGFKRIDEIFIHSDKHTYIFSGDKYMTLFRNDNNTKTLLPVKNIGHGNDEKGRSYVGWKGLKHDKYIDAVVHDYGEVTYLFQDHLVYLWNSSIQTHNDKHHLPRGAVARGWPKKISEVFPGLPNKLDTAFLYYYNRKMHFVKGELFYTWDKLYNRTKGPHLVKDYWRYLCSDYVCGMTAC